MDILGATYLQVELCGGLFTSVNSERASFDLYRCVASRLKHETMAQRASKDHASRSILDDVHTLF